MLIIKQICLKSYFKIIYFNRSYCETARQVYVHNDISITVRYGKEVWSSNNNLCFNLGNK